MSKKGGVISNDLNKAGASFANMGFIDSIATSVVAARRKI
jgi:hypothetical protein